jgi:hypothetical protein
MEETTIPAEWALIDVDKAGKMNGHFKNGVAHHFDETPEDGDFVIEDGDLEALERCEALLPVEDEDP